MWMLQKSVKKSLACLLIVSMVVFALVAPASADAIPGETVVTLGAGLSQEQQTKILNEMGVNRDEVEILFVTIDEEYHYLGQYIDASIIGNQTFSSARITLTEEETGITVQSNNIWWVTDEMYANALATAGVQNADVYVTAPFEVSGTGALTGLIKAFEAAADVVIDEEQKQVANEELVRTAELADKIGPEEAAELIRRLKEALGDTTLETDDDYRQLILRVADELGVQLSEEDIQALIHLLKRLQGLDINWDQVSDQLKNIRDNLNEILDSEETRNFLRQLLDGLISFFDWLKDAFSN